MDDLSTDDLVDVALLLGTDVVVRVVDTDDLVGLDCLTVVLDECLTVVLE